MNDVGRSVLRGVAGALGILYIPPTLPNVAGLSPEWLLAEAGALLAGAYAILGWPPRLHSPARPTRRLRTEEWGPRASAALGTVWYGSVAILMTRVTVSREPIAYSLAWAGLMAAYAYSGWTPLHLLRRAGREGGGSTP